jgi:uncharacterized membrane protein YphA (DoxX/SURF4 family)
MTFAQIARIWDRFFFAPVSPYPVAAFRILQGIMYLQFALSLTPDLYIWFGAPGIVTEKTLYTDAVNKLNILSYFPTSNEWVFAVWMAMIIASICLTIGFQTRIASIIVFIVIVTFANRNGYLFNAGDTYLRTVAFWLVFAPSNQVWSIDSWLRNRKRKAPYDPLISAWTWRALQIQMCIVYYSAFYAKTGGWYWSVGEAVYIAARFESLQRIPMPFSFDTMLFSQLFTFGTLFIEFALFTLIWVRELRYYVLACGLCMHLTIDWFMSIPMFEWLMIVSFVLFIDPVDILNMVNMIKCSFRSILGIKGAPSSA